MNRIVLGLSVLLHAAGTTGLAACGGGGGGGDLGGRPTTFEGTVSAQGGGTRLHRAGPPCRGRGVTSHIFRIDLSGTPQFNNGFANPGITVQWACQICHGNTTFPIADDQSAFEYHPDPP